MFITRLIREIADEYNIRKHLKAAKKCNKYLIAIVYQLNKDDEEFKRYWTVHSFLQDEVLEALGLVYSDINKRGKIFHDLLNDERIHGI